MSSLFVYMEMTVLMWGSERGYVGAKLKIISFWFCLIVGWLVCFLIGCFVGVQVGLLFDHGCKPAGAVIQVTAGTVSCRWGRCRQVEEISRLSFILIFFLA